MDAPADNWWSADPVADAPTAAPHQPNSSPFARAISSIESGSPSGQYDLLGPRTKSGDRAFGRYQVMGSNVPEWSEAALGKRLTPQEFLADPKAQDAVFEHRFGQYAKKYGPTGAAKAWFAGEGGMKNSNARDVLGTTVSSYANKFNRALGQAPAAPQGASAMGFAAPAAPAADPIGAFIHAPDAAPAPQAAPMPAPQPTYGAMPQPAFATSPGPQQQAQMAPMPPPAPSAAPAAMPWENDPPAAAMPWDKDPPAEPIGPPAPPEKSLYDYIPAAIKDVPGEAYKATANALTNVRDNLLPGHRDFPNEGPVERLTKTGSGLMSAASLPLQPFYGAARSLMGHPLADAIHAAGTVINPEVAAKDDMAKMYEDAKGGVDTALSAMMPRGVTPMAPRGPAGPAVPPPVTPAQTIAEASERLGVPIPRAATTDSIPMQSTAGALKEVPVIGAPLVRASKTALGELDRAVGDTVAGYGSGQPLSAGEAAFDGIEGWIGGKSKEVAKRLYDNVDALVDQTHTRPIYSTQRVIADIMAKRANAKMSGVSPAVGEVLDASQTAGGLNYAGLKDLRSHIGDMTPEEMVAKGINKAEAKRIYGAMTDDLRGTVLDAGGPDALRAFDKASTVYDTIVDKRKALAKIIGTKGDASPERALARITEMAQSKGGANYNGLVQVRRAIGPDKWDEVTSSVINRMGRDKPGADFSGDRFKTSWDAMPDNTRRLLFNSTNKPGLAKSVEDIMTLSDAHKQLMKYGNPSGTGRVATLGGMVAMVWANPLGALGSAVGGNVMARIMASPIAAKQTATWMNSYVNAVQNGSPARISAALTSSAHLAANLNKQFGTALSGTDLIRLQGPVPGRADEEQPKPEREGDE